MSAVLEPAAAPAFSTGVTLACGLALPREAIAAVLRETGDRARPERHWGPSDETLGTLAFSADGDAALVVIREVKHAEAAARRDVALLLEMEPVAAYRIDTVILAGTGAFAQADAALVMIADALARRYGALVLDDLGHAYEPDELAGLAALGLPRSSAFSFAREAARRAAALEVPLVELPALTATVDAEAPPQPYPDVATARRVGFVAVGPYVPLTTLARIELARSGDLRANPAGTPITLVAPNLSASEALRFAAIGIDVVVAPDALGADALAAGEEAVAPGRPVRYGERDEVSVFARSLSASVAVRTLEALALELGAERAAGAPEGPSVITTGAVRTAGALPYTIASVAFDGVAVDVSYLDLAHAAPAFTTAVRARRELQLLLGGPAAAVCSIEWYATHDASSTGAFERSLQSADALAARIACALVRACGGLAGDAIGAVYGPDELARLAEGRRGLAQSWSARAAAVALVTE